MRINNTLWVILFATIPLGRPAVAAASNSCERLTALSLPDTTITSAQPIAAGKFASPAGPTEDFGDLPAFCRVAAILRPSADSDIRVEVWMPASGWNGNFQAVGNGGWAGVISYTALGQALRNGYATAATDTGHTGNRGIFGLGHPEKLLDFGYRSEHEMTVEAKEIIKAFYGNGPRISYWNGCSTGGRQALKEAQRFPKDYDGIIAGAPANPRTHLSAWQLWIARAVLEDPISYIPTSKCPMIHKAVLDACDAVDGIKDGLINNPTRCHFSPNVLLCRATDAPTCLTAPQVEAATKILTPLKNPRTGVEIYPTYEPGAELGWALLAGGPEPFVYALDQFRYVVFEDPNWDWRTLNFDTDVASADPIRWTTKRSHALTRKLRHMKELEAQTMPRTSSVPVNSEPSTARLCSLTYPFLTCWECLRRMHFGRADISVTDPTETLPDFVAPSTAAAGFSVTPKCTSSRRSASTTATNRLRNLVASAIQTPRVAR
jgi:feruloyl esterase